MTDPFALDGRLAVISGSTRGLGLAIARTLGGAGARVAINGRDGAAVAETVAALEGEGIAALPLAFDVGDPEAAARAVSDLAAAEGGLDIMVHNAGHSRRGAVADYATEDWERMIAVHLTAGFVLGREAARAMRPKGRGRILFTSSMVAGVGRQGAGSYAAAKGGLNALVRTMAAELGPDGITVNAIAPGYVATELTRALHEDPAFDGFVRRRTPAGRWGLPEEIGWAALYLASDAAAYVNGHVLTVDGGMSAVLGD